MGDGMKSDNREPVRKPFNCADQATATWFERAQVCADLVGSIPCQLGTPLSLADIGCGDQKLRNALEPRGLLFSYSGYDLLPQTPDVDMFDVRRDALPRKHDVAIMLGVIEYLADLATVLAGLARDVRYLVVSHVVRQNDEYSAEHLTALGWLNHLAAGQLESMLKSSGFLVMDGRMTPDGKTKVFLCRSAAFSPTPE